MLYSIRIRELSIYYHVLEFFFFFLKKFAMATVVVQQHQQPVRQQRSPSPPPLTPAISLNASPRSQTPIPNKHLPVCPPGPPKTPATPPQSPSLKHVEPLRGELVLYPPNSFPKSSHDPPVYSIDADDLAAALEKLAAQALPDPKQVFPWLHGLHPENHIQLAFFVRRRSLRRTPRCLRTITIVKVGGDLTKARIKGAVSPQEILTSLGSTFLDADPPAGFSVRNFQIQTAKLAPLSDIVVYGENGVEDSEVSEVARQISLAQMEWKQQYDPNLETPMYNTFILSSKFSIFPKPNFCTGSLGSD